MPDSGIAPKQLLKGRTDILVCLFDSSTYRRPTGKNACPTSGGESGFSLIELMIALGILLSVSAIVAQVMFQMTMTQGTISNRTAMHSSVRSATELLQQEIGQAGSIALPPPAVPLLLLGAVTGLGASATPGVTDSTGMFPGMQLVIGPDAVSGCPGVQCASRETVTLTAVGTNTITAIFQDPHAVGAAVSVAGVFAAGVVPISGDKIITIDAAGANQVTTLTSAQASSGTLLKLFGDINGDGIMVYVEYACNTGTPSAPGTFTRSVTPFTAGAQVAAQPLLTNLLANPGGAPCFDYQRKPVGNNTYVINVTVTLTVQTETRDPQTNVFQTETKALLNVSPRNIYEAWQLSGSNMVSRIQPMPYTVVNLLP